MEGKGALHPSWGLDCHVESVGINRGPQSGVWGLRLGAQKGAVDEEGGYDSRCISKQRTGDVTCVGVNLTGTM